MNNESKLAPYINFSEKYFTKFVLFWCTALLLIGLYAVNDMAVAIAAPLMTVLMYFAAIAMVSFVIGLQRANRFNSAKSKFLEYVVLFFWAFGVFGFIKFLIAGIFKTTEFEHFNYFMLVAAVFPLGVSVGSAKQWRKIKAK